MNMKKIFALLLTLCLLCSAVVLAEGNTTIDQSSADKTASTTLKATVDESYTVIIPSELNITTGATTTPLTVKVEALSLHANRQLKVTVDTTSGNLVNGSNNLPFTVTVGDTNATSLVFNAIAQKDFSINIADSAWKSAAAGDYTATLTFSISIEPVTANIEDVTIID